MLNFFSKASEPPNVSSTVHLGGSLKPQALTVVSEGGIGVSGYNVRPSSDRLPFPHHFLSGETTENYIQAMCLEEMNSDKEINSDRMSAQHVPEAEPGLNLFQAHLQSYDCAMRNLIPGPP